jgi:galactitol-specific phosphotransferase system IIB component
MAEEQNKSAKESAEIFAEQIFIQEQEKFNNELSKTSTLYSEINDKIQEVLYSNEDIVSSFRKTIKESAILNSENIKSIQSLATIQTNAIKDATALISLFETDSKKIQKTLDKNNNLISILKDRVKDLQDKGAISEFLELQQLIGNLELANKQLENFKETLSGIKGFKISENFDKFADNIPVLGSLIKKNLTTPFREGAKESAKLVGATTEEAYKAGLKSISKTLKIAFASLFIDSLLEVNKQITELQKNLGISSIQAQNLRVGFAQTAANAGDLFITSAKLQKAFNEFSGELGGAVENSGQVLETFTNLTGRFGLNTQEAAKLTSILGLQNENTEQVLENTIKTINASRTGGKEFLNTKQIIKDISNISFNVVATLGKSPDILAKAATRARELGLNLEQVEKIADSLLNFESSISAELTAELLTGKQLNLERARFLALNNDIEGVMNEINKQGINFTEFTKMNRIAQEGLANTLGMSRSEMTEMLFKQEQQTLQIKASKGELDEQTLAQFKALDAQEKFNLAIEKAKAAFSDIVIVLSPVLDFVALLANIMGAVFDHVSRVGGALGKWLSPMEKASTTTKEIKDTTAELGKLIVIAGVAFAAYKTTLGTIKLLQEVINTKKRYEVALEIVKQAVATKGVALLIAAGAGIAAYTMLNSLEKSATKTEDLMAPADGSPLLLKKGQAPIQGIPDDNVIFTTNNISSPTNPQMNTNEIINELKNLKQALVEYRSVPVVIENNIDGRELNRNTINGLRKGYLTTPSVYT